MINCLTQHTCSLRLVLRQIQDLPGNGLSMKILDFHFRLYGIPT